MEAGLCSTDQGISYAKRTTTALEELRPLSHSRDVELTDIRRFNLAKLDLGLQTSYHSPSLDPQAHYRRADTDLTDSASFALPPLDGGNIDPEAGIIGSIPAVRIYLGLDPLYSRLVPPDVLRVGVVEASGSIAVSGKPPVVSVVVLAVPAGSHVGVNVRTGASS